MNAADLVAELERRFPARQGPHRAVCQTGAKYVTIGFEDWSEHGGEDDSRLGQRITGVIRECAYRKLYDTEDEACAAFLLAFNAYTQAFAANPDGDPHQHPIYLYWRYDAPHIFWHQEDKALRCRLVLSALPVVDMPDDEYDACRTAELQREILGGADV